MSKQVPFKSAKGPRHSLTVDTESVAGCPLEEVSVGNAFRLGDEIWVRAPYSDMIRNLIGDQIIVVPPDGPVVGLLALGKMIQVEDLGPANVTIQWNYR